MVLELQAPFIKNFKGAYLNVNSENRRTVMLVPKMGRKTSMSYARYLMCCHLNRILTKEEQVDHKDEDKTNDDIDNLQILTISQNNKKTILMNGRSAKTITLTCPQCYNVFTRSARHLKPKLNAGKQPCCSKECAGKYCHPSNYFNRKDE